MGGSVAAGGGGSTLGGSVAAGGGGSTLGGSVAAGGGGSTLGGSVAAGGGGSTLGGSVAAGGGGSTLGGSVAAGGGGSTLGGSVAAGGGGSTLGGSVAAGGGGGGGFGGSVVYPLVSSIFLKTVSNVITLEASPWPVSFICFKSNCFEISSIQNDTSANQMAHRRNAEPLSLSLLAGPVTLCRSAFLGTTMVIVRFAEA